jgi:hypothetical protein
VGVCFAVVHSETTRRRSAVLFGFSEFPDGTAHLISVFGSPGFRWIRH